MFNTRAQRILVPLIGVAAVFLAALPITFSHAQTYYNQPTQYSQGSTMPTYWCNGYYSYYPCQQQQMNYGSNNNYNSNSNYNYNNSSYGNYGQTYNQQSQYHLYYCQGYVSYSPCPQQQYHPVYTYPTYYYYPSYTYYYPSYSYSYGYNYSYNYNYDASYGGYYYGW